MEDEVGKYRKKKKSSTSKSKYKSKHKHEYKSCLIRYCSEYFGRKQEHVFIESYCVLCGKIGTNIDSNRIRSEKTENGLYRMLTSKEILERNDDLPIFDLDDWDSKYVPLENI